MKKKTLFFAAAAVATTGIAAAILSGPEQAEADADAAKVAAEKCFGVVKAGKNDCGAKGGAHDCAGKATADADGNEWLYLPKGKCERVGGQAEAIDKAKAFEADQEKCYGTVLAGKNDCGANGHSCAGQAVKDNDPAEWLILPKGLCERLAKGSTEAGGSSS